MTCSMAYCIVHRHVTELPHFRCSLHYTHLTAIVPRKRLTPSSPPPISLRSTGTCRVGHQAQVEEQEQSEKAGRHRFDASRCSSRSGSESLNIWGRERARDRRPQEKTINHYTCFYYDITNLLCVTFVFLVASQVHNIGRPPIKNIFTQNYQPPQIYYDFTNGMFFKYGNLFY